MSRTLRPSSLWRSSSPNGPAAPLLRADGRSAWWRGHQVDARPARSARSVQCPRAYHPRPQRRARAPCSMAPSKAYANCPTFVSKSCREWPILRCGGRPARRPSGRRARSYAPITPTVAQRLTGSSRPTPWPPFVRQIMAERTTWTGKASDLLQARVGEKNTPNRAGAWPTNPRALAARLRRCQTFLRAAGIEIAFSREGRVGSRIIRMTSVTTSRQPSTATAGNGRDT